MINPYLCYVFSFSFALLVYGLGWSSLYPPLSISLVGFIASTCIIHFIASRWWNKNGAPTTNSPLLFLNPLLVTIFIYLLWSVEFIYQGIPVVKILLQQPFNYRIFGVPSLHVFIVTFSSFYTLHLFRCYLQNRSPRLLLLYVVNLVAAILIYSRAMLFFNLTGSLILWLFTRPVFSLRWAALLPLAVIILFFFFGVLGTLRDSAESHVAYSPSLFMETGKATPGFRASAIPGEFFWSYIYITSPLANLQTNIDSTRAGKSISDLVQMINNEWLPDAASKRINRLMGWQRKTEVTIPGPFNVSTVYSRSYSYLGWLGIALTAVLAGLIPLVYRRLLGFQPRFEPEGLAILCSMFLFLFYDNTIRFTGLSFQLVYPFVCGWLSGHLKASKNS